MFPLLDLLRCLTQRNSGSEIERNRNRRKEACVIDLQGRSTRLTRSKRGQRRHCRAIVDVCFRLDEEIADVLWRLPIFRRHFQHHVILVQLGVNNGNLGLSESRIESAVERLRRLAQTRGLSAIVRNQLPQPPILLVAVHVLQAGKLLHVLQQDRSPVHEVFDVVGLNGVLIERAARSASDTEILHWLKKGRRHRQMVQFGPQPVDDLRRSNLSFIQRLECYENKSAVTCSVAARISVHILHRGIRLDYIHQLEDGIVHEGERRVLRSLHSADQHAGILLWEESFGKTKDENKIQNNREQQDADRDNGIVQHPDQRFSINAKH